MSKYTIYAIVYIIFAIAILAILATAVIVSAEDSPDLIEIEQFLFNDTTDQHEYLPWYTCGHYSRDLARNASEHNLSIGSMIISNHPVFRGKWNSHVVNYVMLNDTIVVICPETDQILALNPGMVFDGRTFKYYRLYPDGTQVPSNWAVNLAHTGHINEEAMQDGK